MLRLELRQREALGIRERAPATEQRHALLAKRRREISRGDLVLLGERDRALDGVLQLAHVTRVIVAHEVHLSVLGEAGHALPQLPREFLAEEIREQRDVLASL